MKFENRYSTLDRTLHRLAFSTRPAQLALADIEDWMFSTELAEVDIKRPVFVTALPRAGTTLLLQLFVETGEFASHNYRDMPFVLCPILWDKFSAYFRQRDIPRERAHGDGMLVSVDSPEAFEEILWIALCRHNYRPDYIEPWSGPPDPELTSFLQNHVRKIVCLRRRDNTLVQRYISKNNHNIARIRTLQQIFSDAMIIVPFRDPIQHAASLLHQHQNFLEIHTQDKFARDYMAAIGHYDFGQNLRPINFNNWLKHTSALAATTYSFWLEYWVATYGQILTDVGKHVIFLNFECMFDNPKGMLSKFAEILELDISGNLVSKAELINRIKPRHVNTDGVCTKLIKRAMSLHADLISASLL